MSTESEQETSSEANISLDAEQFTSTAEEFLKRLGYKRGLQPTKATLEGEQYVVEMESKKKTAKVQIDTRTNEIREFEILEKPSEFGFLRRNVLIIAGVSIAAACVAVLKFMGFF
ncbi:MAG: hypothetical protein PVF15_02680 [Candidatus Bathyarchaeota archaeon]|jgi:hypothetical protein